MPDTDLAVDWEAIAGPLQRELNERDRRLGALRREIDQAALGGATVIRIERVRELLKRGAS